jgi:uncharacterized protein YjbI with pentapeptide repeats
VDVRSVAPLVVNLLTQSQDTIDPDSLSVGGRDTRTDLELLGGAACSNALRVARKMELHLGSARLACADFIGADLTGALLVRPNLTGARLTGSI